MVTAENGTLTLVGVSGRQYGLSIYISDVVNAYCTISLNGLAGTGSTNFYIIPEDCQIKDVSITTGNTVATVLIPQVNDVNVGTVISIANCISTLQNRAIPNLGFKAGRKLTLVQG